MYVCVYFLPYNVFVLALNASSVHWYATNSRTRKLSYRKDGRAMRPIYECPENLRESLSTPTATFAELLMGFCSDRSYECI